MFILDTDVLTLIQQKSGEPYQRLSARIEPVEDITFATVVSVEEQFRGWLAFAAKAKTPEQYVDASGRFARLLEFFRDRRLLAFDARAVVEFKKLKAARVNIGTMDLRIAAIALANAATLVTRNLSDFGKAPGLVAEDWARP